MIGAVNLGLAVGVLGGGTARADIPDANGVYTGCYSRNDGDLRVIDYAAGVRCRPREITVTWNEQGRRGPAGPQGETGPAGTVNTAPAFGDIVTVPLGESRSSFAVCPPGQTAISGGHGLGDGLVPTVSNRITTNTPDDTWQVVIHHPANDPRGTPNTGQAIAYCAP
ncbi:hypothetical protein [Streptomyces sp. NPDC053431]|uniref:hypothetical protein n=1 Tax=Streptomyces sp. NPDC053431 TaxID=3365703 RepID=UPI0037D2B018